MPGFEGEGEETRFLVRGVGSAGEGGLGKFLEGFLVPFCARGASGEREGEGEGAVGEFGLGGLVEVDAEGVPVFF